MKVLIVAAVEENMPLHGVFQRVRKWIKFIVHLEMQGLQNLQNV